MSKGDLVRRLAVAAGGIPLALCSFFGRADGC